MAGPAANVTLILLLIPTDNFYRLLECTFKLWRGILQSTAANHHRMCHLYVHGICSQQYMSACGQMCETCTGDSQKGSVHRKLKKTTLQLEVIQSPPSAPEIVVLYLKTAGLPRSGPPALPSLSSPQDASHWLVAPHVFFECVFEHRTVTPQQRLSGMSYEQMMGATTVTPM